MAMSETVPPGSDWVQFYEQSPLTQSETNYFGGGRVSDATVVSTTVTSPTAAPPPEGGGRGSRPVRRRTRASRRTPTTVLNTDTANFRAMVQQFTGGVAAAYQIPSGSSLNFGFGLAGNLPNPARTTMQFQPSPPPPQQQQSRSFVFTSPSSIGGASVSFPAAHNLHGSSSSSGNENRNNNETNNYMF